VELKKVSIVECQHFFAFSLVFVHNLHRIEAKAEQMRLLSRSTAVSTNSKLEYSDYQCAPAKFSGWWLSVPRSYASFSQMVHFYYVCVVLSYLYRILTSHSKQNIKNILKNDGLLYIDNVLWSTILYHI